MDTKDEYFKILSKIESHIILTNDSLYERQQWPTLVEWWKLSGTNYNSADKLDHEAAEPLEKIFRERR